MTTRIKFLKSDFISYGPQFVAVGQIMDVSDDSQANYLIAIGMAVLDSTDPTNTPPLVDGNEAEQEAAIG